MGLVAKDDGWRIPGDHGAQRPFDHFVGF